MGSQVLSNIDSILPTMKKICLHKLKENSLTILKKLRFQGGNQNPNWDIKTPETWWNKEAESPSPLKPTRKKTTHRYVLLEKFRCLELAIQLQDTPGAFIN